MELMMLRIRSASRWRMAGMLAVVMLLAACSGGKPAYDRAIMELTAADIYQQALDRLIQGDIKGAMPILNEAAEKGNAQAKYQLGLIYARGDAVRRDMNRAHDFLLAAARLGHAKAQYHLAHMYGTGDGIPRDYKQAYIWFWMAASYGDTNAKRYMRVVVPKLSPEEYRQAEVEFKQLWEQMPPDSKKRIPRQTMAMH